MVVYFMPYSNQPAPLEFRAAQANAEWLIRVRELAHVVLALVGDFWVRGRLREGNISRRPRCRRDRTVIVESSTNTVNSGARIERDDILLPEGGCRCTTTISS